MSTRNSYTSGYKLKAVQLAENLGSLNKAAIHLGISHTLILRWRDQKIKLEALPRLKRADRGKSAQFPELETKLFDWVSDKRKQGMPISTTALRLKAKLIAKSGDSESYDNFKASFTWCYSFMRRKNISIRRRTHLAQKLPCDLERKVVEFQRFIIQQRKLHNFELDLIINADQTPLTFDMIPNTTLELTGSKSVNIRTTG